MGPDLFLLIRLFQPRAKRRSGGPTFSVPPSFSPPPRPGSRLLLRFYSITGLISLPTSRFLTDAMSSWATRAAAITSGFAIPGPDRRSPM